MPRFVSVEVVTPIVPVAARKLVTPIFVTVIAPVVADTEMPVPAEVEDTNALPNEFCLALKIVQSPEER